MVVFIACRNKNGLLNLKFWQMKIYFLLALVVAACSSSHLVESHSAQNETHPRNKILVIGISTNPEARNTFEKGLQEMLRKEDIVAVKSLDYFEPSFIYKSFSEEELLALEKRLLADDFDSVLITKVQSTEDKIAQPHPITYYKNFREDYYESQVFKDERMNEPENYTVYHTQTSLYDLVKDEKRMLVWSGDIDIVNPENIQKDVKQYIKLLLKTLKKERILSF